MANQLKFSRAFSSLSVAWPANVLRTTLPVAMIGLLAACGAGDPAGGDAVVVRDSAGITIVENTGDGSWEADEAWRLSAEPTLQIGVLNGPPEYQLYDVRDAVRLSDGRIVVANTGTHELRYYDSAGQHLRTVGGEGGGPGEFQALNMIAVIPGDTLYAWDYRGRRLSVFGPEGRFLRAENRADALEALGVLMRGVYADGSILLDRGVSMSSMPSEGTQVVRDTVGFLRVNRAGAAVDTLGPFPGNERILSIDRADSGISVRIRGLPFGREAFVEIEGDRAYVALSGRWQVGVYSADGRLTRLVRLDRPRPAVTPDDITHYIEGEINDAEDPNRRRDIRATLEAIPFPERFPFFSQMNVDATGHMWVREFERPAYDGPQRWNVFNTEGRLLGTVEVPQRMRVVQIGSDFVLGVAESDLGIERVRLYRLIKPAR